MSDTVKKLSSARKWTRSALFQTILTENDGLMPSMRKGKYLWLVFRKQDRSQCSYIYKEFIQFGDHTGSTFHAFLELMKP